MAKESKPIKQSQESKAKRYTANTARIHLALIYFVFGFGYFLMPEPDMSMFPPKAVAFMAALLATGYFLPFLKIVEGICGFMLFFKRWTPLSLLILAPITINILLYGLFIDPSGLPMHAVMVAASVYLMWYNWDKYAPLFKA
jgi:hypothetical protein